MTHEELKRLLDSANEAETRGNYVEAEDLANQVLASVNLADESKVQYSARAHRIRGLVALRRSNYSEALEIMERALALSESAADTRGHAESFNTMGIVHWYLADYPRTIECYLQALAIYEVHGDKVGAASTYGNIAVAYVNINEYDQALEYFSKALSADEEIENELGVARHMVNIGILHRTMSNYHRALEYFQKALQKAEELGYKSGVAKCLSNIGSVYYQLSDYTNALEYYSRALIIDEELGGKVEVSGHLGNIGLVYQQLSDFTKSLEYYHQSLSMDEELGYKKGVAENLTNIGNLYAQISDYPKALEHLTSALEIDEKLGIRDSVAAALYNIGVVYAKQKDYYKAMEYYRKGLLVAEEIDERSHIAVIKFGIGSLFAIADWSFYDEQQAEKYLVESIAMNEEHGLKKFEVHKELSALYNRQGRWKESREQFEKHYDMEKEVLSEESRRAAATMEQRRLIAEHEKEIAIAKTARDARLQATTSLLHKVLPQSIATRMIDGEEEIADYFPQASILFADIAGFTPISSRMPAQIVVRFLNHVFQEFDMIMLKHGCEKIKTIGDGYMGVAGAPITCDDHAERLLSAAIEMQQAIDLPEDIRVHIPAGMSFGVRIGLHTGPVVAGVIGENRFVYDVYSDAVNVASRMESHGEPHRIHLSDDFVRHIQSRVSVSESKPHHFAFESRGLMEIKGKGMMRTYFLERA